MLVVNQKYMFLVEHHNLSNGSDYVITPQLHKSSWWSRCTHLTGFIFLAYCFMIFDFDDIWISRASSTKKSICITDTPVWSLSYNVVYAYCFWISIIPTYDRVHLYDASLHNTIFSTNPLYSRSIYVSYLTGDSWHLSKYTRY